MSQEKILKCLETHLKTGNCLHGSQLELQVLKPMPAHCESGREEGCLTAVYASRDCVQVPIIMALLTGPGLSSYNGDGTHLAVKGDRTFAPGYVYVLSHETFRNYRGECVSFVPVTPIERIWVTPSILRLLIERGTLDLKIPIPAPY